MWNRIRPQKNPDSDPTKRLPNKIHLLPFSFDIKVNEINILLLHYQDPDPTKFQKPNATSFQKQDPDPTKTPGSGSATLLYVLSTSNLQSMIYLYTVLSLFTNLTTECPNIIPIFLH